MKSEEDWGGMENLFFLLSTLSHRNETIIRRSFISKLVLCAILKIPAT